MSGAIPPLLNTPSWRGAQLKHRDNLSVTKHHATEAEVKFQVFETTSVPDIVKWSAKKAPATL
jgi:hypothetical protein